MIFKQLAMVAILFFKMRSKYLQTCFHSNKHFFSLSWDITFWLVDLGCTSLLHTVYVLTWLVGKLMDECRLTGLIDSALKPQVLPTIPSIPIVSLNLKLEPASFISIGKSLGYMDQTSNISCMLSWSVYRHMRYSKILLWFKKIFLL